MNMKRCRTVRSLIVITGLRALTHVAKAQSATVGTFTRSAGLLSHTLFCDVDRPASLEKDLEPTRTPEPLR
jgi:hypothetical protein